MGTINPCPANDQRSSFAKYRVLLAICAISCGIILLNGLPSFPDTSPELVRISPGERLNIGRVISGKSYSFNIEIAAGNAKAITLAAVKTECRCTVAAIPDNRAIVEGKPCMITITWTPSGNAGRQQKNVLIQYLADATLYSKVVAVEGFVEELPVPLVGRGEIRTMSVERGR